MASCPMWKSCNMKEITKQCITKQCSSTQLELTFFWKENINIILIYFTFSWSKETEKRFTMRVSNAQFKWCVFQDNTFIKIAMQFFTRGQFWPSGIVVVCVCLCVRPSVRPCINHELVRVITHRPFKLGSPNLDHRCKKTLVKIPIVLGGDWPWPLRSNLTSKSKFTPFCACPGNNSSPVQKLGSPNLGQRCKIPWLISLLFWGLIGLDRSNLS